jgi:hypothetical protein
MKQAELDEIEVIDLEEYACSDRPIPKHVKYFKIRVDKEKFNVQSPITAKEILIVADLDPCDYGLEQILRGGERVRLEFDHVVDLREPGIERFETILTKEIQIIVNGREKFVTSKVLSFSEIVALAFDDPPTGPNICFTITFRKGHDSKPEGTLVEGETIKIKKGEIFNVTATDKS